MRGAPAIAIVGMLSLSVELQALDVTDWPTARLGQWIVDKCDRLLTARPTAINLRNSREHLVNLISTYKGDSAQEMKNMLVIVFFAIRLFAFFKVRR